MYGHPARPPLPPRHQQHYGAQRWQPPNNPHSGINPYQPHRGTTIPFLQRPDLRFPGSSSTKDPQEPTTLLSPDGEYTAHLVALLTPPSRRLEKLLLKSRQARASTLETVFPEDLITRALAAQKLRHVSDGPKGGIWLVEEGNVEVVVAMVEELEACKEERKGAGGVRRKGVEEDKVEGRWEVLGLGKGGDEGRVFLMHACGFGPKVVEEVKKVEGSGRAAGGGGEKGKGKAVERPKKWWVGRLLGNI